MFVSHTLFSTAFSFRCPSFFFSLAGVNHEGSFKMSPSTCIIGRIEYAEDGKQCLVLFVISLLVDILLLMPFHFIVMCPPFLARRLLRL
jgi:hypothetical protein